MDTERIESFKQFAKYLEYPMVVFEAESGKVLDINYQAEVLLGCKAKNIRIEPGRAFTKFEFWEMLHGKKSIIWHRIRMFADDKEVLVSGLVNEMMERGVLIYTVLFERRADLNIGSLTLERIVEHAGIVALHVSRLGNGFEVEYVSRNINQFGYSRGQLYDKVVDFREIICPEDYERFYEKMKDEVLRHVSESTMECRVLTESRDLIPIRLLMHYIYNEYGQLTDIELMILDLRDEERRTKEKAYLNNAITKMKNVVVVKSYQAGERKLCYVSPNANMVGMNVEALRKGYKLTEDYIHPEDRDSVMDAIYQAIANGVTDYVQVYRMVRDDGKKIWVENEVTVRRISDGEAEISFLITDITEQKDIEKEMVAALEEETMPPVVQGSNSLDSIIIDASDVDMRTEFQMLADALSVNADYYSMVLDAEGKQLTKPAGPQKDMGLFYDIFERPRFKEEFKQMSERVKLQRTPQSVAFDVDALHVNMIFAPLMLEENVSAYWVLTSFAPDGAIHLGEVVGVQWKLANSIVKYFYLQDTMGQETKSRKLTELQLHKEQTEHRVIEEVLSSMSRGGDAALGEMCYKAGIYLNVENIGLYLQNKDTGKVERYYLWDIAGEDREEFDNIEMSKSEYEVLKEQFAEENVFVANAQVQNPYLKEMMKKIDKSLLVCQLVVSSEREGFVVFGSGDRSREYDNMDKHFATTVISMFISLLSRSHKKNMPNMLQTSFLEVYDHIRDAVYVKDNKTGEIIFANKAMDKLFGYSLVGMQATDVITDTMEKYRNIGGVRKRFITDKKVTKWQTYVKELDQIMNIVEVHMETIYGADCSLFILKKNKEKKKGKE